MRRCTSRSRQILTNRSRRPSPEYQNRCIMRENEEHSPVGFHEAPPGDSQCRRITTREITFHRFRGVIDHRPSRNRCPRPKPGPRHPRRRPQVSRRDRYPNAVRDEGESERPRTERFRHRAVRSAPVEPRPRDATKSLFARSLRRYSTSHRAERSRRRSPVTTSLDSRYHSASCCSRRARRRGKRTIS